jgi:hypothetical protein
VDHISSLCPSSGVTAAYDTAIARASSALARAARRAWDLGQFGAWQDLSDMQLHLHALQGEVRMPHRPLRASATVRGALAKAAVDACVSKSEASLRPSDRL